MGLAGFYFFNLFACARGIKSTINDIIAIAPPTIICTSHSFISSPIVDDFVAQPYMFSCLYDTGTVLFHGKYYSNVLFTIDC